MKPYYQDEWITQYCDDALRVLPELESDSIDLLATDPPYGIGFMGKDWDRALPDKRIWAECLRVLKPGAFAFVMSIPRSDCLARMIISLQDVGFRVDFTPIYWAYASGFPKAQNIGKAVDKRLGISEVEYREPFGREHRSEVPTGSSFESPIQSNPLGDGRIGYHKASTPQAKALDGSYGGFQPKPAVEVIIVCMKPLSEKTFVDQALKNRKGITWLDDCRIPYESEEVDFSKIQDGRIYGDGICIGRGEQKETTPLFKPSGRFQANLLVSDDVLNDGRMSKGGDYKLRSSNRTAIPFDPSKGWHDHSMNPNEADAPDSYGDSGSFSRYFDLDKWAAKTFPFLIVPKASKSEKEQLLDMPRVVKSGLPLRDGSGDYVINEAGDGSQSSRRTRTKNTHPTVKPFKLMSYLITLGSRPGDTILDPFGGSGTTALASKLLGRKCIISEIEEAYCKIAVERLKQSVMELST